MKTAILTGLTTAIVAFGVPLAVGDSPIEEETTVTTVDEDSPQASCVDDGNRIYGPNNPEGVPPGHYDDGGVLDIPWSQLGIYEV